MKKEMVLTIEAIPSSLWFKSVYRMVDKATWKAIREEVIDATNGFCEVCNRPGNQCHEVWSYDDVKHVQRFERFTLLCQACHNIKHIGWSELQRNSGQVDFDYLVYHYCKVNHCSEQRFEFDKAKAMRLFRERSRHQWSQDFSVLEDHLPSGKTKRASRLYSPNEIRKQMSHSVKKAVKA